MSIEDFFKGVSDAFLSHQKHAIIVYLILLFGLLVLIFYFKFFNKQTEKKLSSKYINKLNFNSIELKDELLEELFLNFKNTDIILNFKNQLYYYIKKYLENNLDSLTISVLNNKYWEFIKLIIHNKFFENNTKNNLIFNDTEKLIIDFAYISKYLLNNQNNIINISKFQNYLTPDINIENYNFKCYTITSWLIENYNTFCNFYIIEQLNKEYEEINSKINITILEKNICQKTKQLLLLEILKRNNNLQLIKQINNKIDKLIDKYAFYKFKSDNGLTTKDEISEIINIENFLVNSLREERKNELKLINLGEKYNLEFINLENEIINKEYEILKLLLLKSNCILELQKYEQSKEQLSNKNKIEFLNSKIDQLKNILEFATKLYEIEPIIFLTKEPNQNIINIILEGIAKYIEIEPLVFNSKITKKIGLPSILIVPGYGNGIYNPEHNLLIFYEFPLRTYHEMIISAIANYKWETDYDSSLKNTFHNLKCNKRLSFSALRQAFIKDLVLYTSTDKDPPNLEKEVIEYFKSINIKKDKKIKIKNLDDSFKNFNNIANNKNINVDSNIIEISSKSEEDLTNKVTTKQSNLTNSEILKNILIDKLSILFDNDKELINQKITIETTNESKNFNIYFKDINFKIIEEIFKIIFENPKLKNNIINIIKKLK